MDGVPIGELLGIAACLGLNAFFSATETALTALSKLQGREQTEMHEAAKVMPLWNEHPLEVLTTILIGKNLAKLAAGVLITHLCLQTLGTWSLPVAIVATTLLVLVVGEMVPKAVALPHAHRMAPRLLSALRLPHILLHDTGIAKLFTGLTRWISFGRQPVANRPLLSESDLEFLIALGARDGILSKEKEAMLQSVLEFSDTLVKGIMVPRTSIKAVDVETDIAELQAFLQEELHSRVPVYKGSLDHIVGIFHVKDILRIEETFNLSKVMRQAHFVPMHRKINDLLKDLKRRRIHMAMVVDEFGGTAGLVTMEDILEEIVGDIDDEYDVEEQDLLALAADGSWIVDAKADLTDLEERLKLEFPEDREYNSLGGFMIAQTGRILPKGSSLSFQGYQFEVLDSDDRRIAKVQIRLLQPSDSADAAPLSASLRV